MTHVFDRIREAVDRSVSERLITHTPVRVQRGSSVSDFSTVFDQVHGLENDRQVVSEFEIGRLLW